MPFRAGPHIQSIRPIPATAITVPTGIVRFRQMWKADRKRPEAASLQPLPLTDQLIERLVKPIRVHRSIKWWCTGSRQAYYCLGPPRRIIRGEPHLIPQKRSPLIRHGPGKRLLNTDESVCCKSVDLFRGQPYLCHRDDCIDASLGLCATEVVRVASFESRPLGDGASARPH
jgi:hypothetical protein